MFSLIRKYSHFYAGNFFAVLRGRNSALLGKLGDFFPNFENKKSQSSKKKKKIILRFGFSFSQNRHKLHGDVLQFNDTRYMVTFSFNLMAIVCVIAILFYY